MENKQEQQEIFFHKDNNVTVTQSRYIADSKTYAMRNISSVSIFTVKASYTFQIILLLIGLILLGAGSILIGIIVTALSILLIVTTKDKYTVRISTNAGEANSFISKDKDYIQKVVGAVNDAMIYRG